MIRRRRIQAVLLGLWISGCNLVSVVSSSSPSSTKEDAAPIEYGVDIVRFFFFVI